MRKLASIICIACLFAACQTNKLSQSEEKNGYQLLFDGTSTHGWRGAYLSQFPSHGWVIKNQQLLGELSAGKESGDGGDIITLKKYQNFDLSFDWKLGKLGNSGVKYFVEELAEKPKNSSSLVGYEYQLIDDQDFIYNEKHLPEDHKTGALYNISAPNKPNVKIGQWHTSRIVVKGDQIEHYLDKRLILSINRSSEEFKNGYLASKFKSIAGYDKRKEGYILLQDHGHNVSFKNIKIKELK
jgi:hypothetical protein